MYKVLVTGGTVFVSKRVAAYFVKQGYQVFVLNRGTRQQIENVHLIKGDRHELSNELSNYNFDAIVDVTAYCEQDIVDLYDKLHFNGPYIMVSSSAVYPDNEKQPFKEETSLGVNMYWGKYGIDKIAAEKMLLSKNPNAYILRPPYLYGPENNVYREAFVFDCALQKRPFYIPGDGSMPLQFFYIDDLCRLIDRIIKQLPSTHIINTGNPETISIREWVKCCYEIVGTELKLIEVDQSIEQRSYFSFYDYSYCLDVAKQRKILPEVTPLKVGLKQCFEWYKINSDKVRKKPFIKYIDENFN